MKTFSSENLNLTFDAGVAHMMINGPVQDDEMKECMTWFSHLDEETDGFNLNVQMAKENFPDLSAVGAEFKRVGDVLRSTQSIEKCAVLSDSAFVKNSAKVEGAVIPGLEIKTFEIDNNTPADKWLKGESLIETPSATEVESASRDDENADNPWDNLNMKKVAI